jgi:hypothetical protein
MDQDEDTTLTLTPEGEEPPQDDGEDEGKEPELFVDEDDPNLALSFVQSEKGKLELKDVAEQVIDDFDTEREASEEYRQRCADNWKLFAGDLPPKVYPFENSANGHVPIALENISRLVFRAYGELFGRDLWFAVMRMGQEDAEIARILTKHGNWQLQHQISDFRRQMHRGLLAFYHIGDVTCHSFRDELRNRNKHEILTPDDFVIPYQMTSTEPDYSDCPFKIKIMHVYRHELEAKKGLWADVEEVLDRKSPSWEDEPEARMRDAVTETSGIQKPDSTRHAPFKLLQYEGWYKFSSEDNQRYIQAIVDYQTHAVLSLRIYEEEDYQDRLRYDNEIAHGQAYMQAQQVYDSQFAQAQQLEMQLQMALQDPMHDPEEVAIMQQALEEQGQVPPPQPPDWMLGEDGMLNPEAAPAPVRMVPINMYAHGVCIEPLEGTLGLSYGRIQSDLNRGANVMLSQFIDQATLGNISTYFAPETLEFVNSSKQLMPGQVNRVTGLAGGSIKDNLVEIKPGPANPQLMEGVNKFSEMAESSIQAPAVLSGEPGKSGETFRGISMRVEQANMQISVSAGKYADFFKQIAVNNAKLNRLFMNENEMEYIVDAATRQGEYVKIPRQYYDRKYEVCITSDLRFTVKSQRVAEAQELLQVGQMPPLQQNVAYWHKALTKYLNAADHHDVVAALGPAPDDPQTPFGMAPPQPPGPPGGPPGARPGQPAPAPQGPSGGPAQPGRRAAPKVPPTQG